MAFIRKEILLFLLLNLLACNQIQASSRSMLSRPAPAASSKVNDITVTKLEEPRFDEPRFQKVISVKPPRPPFVLRDNARVRYELSKYLKKRRPFVKDGLKRREPYLQMIEKVFEEFNLPVELSNVAFLESRFIPDAKSHRGATGLWQLMKPTARHLGLRVNRWNDQRLDPEKSTRAAAKYLKELHDKFHDWPLALAAYNAGPSKMARIIKKCKTRDFYKLFYCGNLRKETLNFVSKFIALTMISRDPEKYGFYVESYVEQ